MVLRTPSTRSPLPAAGEWDELMADLAQMHDVRVPSSAELADIDEGAPDWGVLAVLIPGAVVLLCLFSSTTAPDGGPAEGAEVVHGLLTADIDAPSVVHTLSGSGERITLGSALQLDPRGTVLTSCAMALERSHDTLVLISTTDVPGIGDLLPRILLTLAESPDPATRND
ncbi:hypothetical protein Bra3105_15165 [Brachybacterium halotolerans subsp. kimchii]|uniref:hypothetical protein n=1 Tax=Brachybacterium halotolerans TaxID=2795215 RepID=UPI001E5423FF|nr:hypothetical protein [Brachybacterium halotolerans]UEJ82164.1 hypothetical protein Bra3105_15165 [Brachybacterium halotolerans subsp. kimchii]